MTDPRTFKELVIDGLRRANDLAAQSLLGERIVMCRCNGWPEHYWTRLCVSPKPQNVNPANRTPFAKDRSDA